MRAELLLSAWLCLAAALTWMAPKLWMQSLPELPSLKQSADGTAFAGVSPAGTRNTKNSNKSPQESSESPEYSRNPAAVALLEQSLSQLRNAPPLVAELDLQINLLNREFRGTGQYCQTGVGIPQTRWDFSLGDSPAGLMLSQIFDGRFFYRLSVHGDEKSLTYVDLYGARDLPETTAQGVAGPTGWLGVGGLPTLLEQLLATHDFEPPTEAEMIEGEDGQQLVLTKVRGRWSKSALRQLLRDQIAPEVLAEEIRWERLPGQMPHAVELVLGTDSYLKAFPYRLTFYQFRPAGKDGYSVQPVFELKLHHVEKRDEIAPEQFRLSADGLNPVDETKDYLNRVKLFTLYPLKESGK
jgi:hypothetical protein